MDEKPYNAGDETQVTKRKRKVKLAQDQAKSDLRWVMSTPAGRRFVWGLLESGQVFCSTFSHDPYLSAFSEGKRRQALDVLGALMDACPEMYLLAMNEATNKPKEEPSNE